MSVRVSPRSRRSIELLRWCDVSLKRRPKLCPFALARSRPSLVRARINSRSNSANPPTMMPHAIIRGENGRRYEVDFVDVPVRVEIYASEETVEIFIGADFEISRRSVGVSPFSTFHAISLAKPPPQRRDVPRTPVPHPRNDERCGQSAAPIPA